MANFKTHVVVAAAVSGIASVAWLNLHLADPWQAGGYFMLGVIGGLLPDIDSDKSAPLNIIFFLLSIFCSFTWLFSLAAKYSYLELFLLWLAMYFGIRFLMLELLTKFTEHRGAFHSLLAVIFVLLITADLGYHVLARSVEVAWNCGVFVALGYLVHLSLDELYSVDLLGRRLKRSFGTALKPLSVKNLGASALMLLASLVLIAYSPPAERYWQGLNKTLAKYDFRHKWVPRDKHWFKGLFA